MPVKADEARSAGDDPAVASCVRAFERELDFVYRVLRRRGRVRPTPRIWRRRSFSSCGDAGTTIGGIGRCGHGWRHRGARGDEALGAPAARVPLASSSPPDGASLPDDDLASARARDLARQAIALLPERHRTALVMHEIDEIPAKDLAALWRRCRCSPLTRIRVAREAFAKIATQLLATPDRAHPALSPDALLAIERVPERAGAGPQGRANASARVVAAAHRALAKA